MRNKTNLNISAALADIMMGEVYAISDWLDINKHVASGEDINKKRLERSRIVKRINRLTKYHLPESSLLTIHR